MPLLYQCIICEHANKSISDLHDHHTQDHNLQELSQTIIDLHGFKIWNQKTHPKPPDSSFKRDLRRPVRRLWNADDTNNNENLYNGFVARPRVSNNDGNCKKPKQLTDRPKNYHDETKCAIDCSPFIPWERELNKRQEINDDDFLDSVESLCYDLGKRKRRGRKKKVRVENPANGNANEIENENTKNLMEYIENVIGVKPAVVEQPIVEIETYQEETMSPENNENTSNIDVNVTPKRTKKEDAIRSVENTTVLAETNATVNSILPAQTKKIVEDVRSEETKSDRDKNILNDEPMCNIFSWNTIITVHADERDTYTEGKNSYYELMLPNIETFL